jgi:MFS family permease
MWSPIMYLIAVGVVMEICAALFRPAQDAFLPQAVPANQLFAAVALNAARGSVAQLSGTAAGGFPFAVARFVPFLADAVAHAVACFLLLLLRVPRREVRPAPTRHLRREIMVGLPWVWAHRHIRVTALWAVVLNLFIKTCWSKLGEYGPADRHPPSAVGLAHRIMVRPRSNVAFAS